MKKTDFEGVMEGLSQAVRHAHGENVPGIRVHVPADVDVKAIRSAMKLTQAQFAARFGFTRATISDWEQRRRRPEASARILLTVIAKEPEAVERALIKA